MTEKIVWRAGEFGGPNRSLLEHVILAAITKAGFKAWDDTPDKDNLEVSMTINGVDVPVRNVFDRIEDHMEKMIEKKAKEFYDDKFREIEDELDEVFGIVKKKMFDNFNITKEDEERY